MRLEYDPEVDAAYIRLRVAHVARSEEVAPGVVLDLDAEGRAIGLELLNASQVLDGPPQGVEFVLLSRALARAGQKSTVW